LPVGVLRAVLFGLGDVRLPALIYVGEAIINLVLSLVLCHWFGLLGVAFGTAIPLLLCELGLLLPLSLKRLSIGCWQGMREVILPQVPPLAALWIYASLLGQM